MAQTFEQFWQENGMSFGTVPKAMAQSIWEASLEAAREKIKEKGASFFYFRRDGKKVAVIGSRDIADETKRPGMGEKDKARVYEVLTKNKDKIKLIISGGARGADTIGVEWATANGVPYLVFPALWHDPVTGVLDKGAGFRRNYDIIKNCDAVLAFVKQGGSPGTNNSLQTAKDLNKQAKVIEFENPPETL